MSSQQFRIYVFMTALLFGFTAASGPTCQSRFLSVSADRSQCPETIPFNCSQCGKVVPISDPRYDDIRRHADSIDINSNAAYIALPRSTNQVVSILRAALENGLRPTVRSGGHCYEDFWANNDGGVLIDLSDMDRIFKPRNDDIIWVEPGVHMDRLFVRLYKHFNVTAPGIVCSDVATGGAVLGGGYGYLARKFGLISDYVDAFEIATVTAERKVKLITVGANSKKDTHRDLYWALRGGGQQNFGVVTNIGFRNLPESPPLVYVYEGRWNLGDDMNETKFLNFMEKYTEFFVNNSGVDNEYCDLFSNLNIARWFNDSFIKHRIMLIGEKQHLVTNFTASVGLDFSKYSCEKMSHFRFSMVNGVRNDVRLDGSYNVRRSAYMVGVMPPHQREATWRYITDPAYTDLMYGSVEVRSYGCAVSRLAESDTAYPHRKAVIKMQYITKWHDAAMSAKHKEWSDSWYKAMYGHLGPRPDGVMDGCYVGYPDRELHDARRLYYKDNYERLMQVKKKWDPLNIFQYNQSVELPLNRQGGEGQPDVG